MKGRAKGRTKDKGGLSQEINEKSEKLKKNRKYFRNSSNNGLSCLINANLKFLKIRIRDVV